MKIKDKIKELTKRKDKKQQKTISNKINYTIEDIYELAYLTGDLKNISKQTTIEKINTLTKTSRKQNLNEYIDEYIDWYFHFFTKGCYTNLNQTQKQKELKNFIEKMAIWYELRYPDYEVSKLIDNQKNDKNSIDEIMFIDNPYLKLNEDLANQLFNNDDSKRINWARFYNFKTFYNSLPDKEKKYLYQPKYHNLIYLNPFYTGIHFHLTNDGYIEEAENLKLLTNNKYNDAFFTGFHIKELLEILKEEGITLPENNQIEKEIKVFEERKYLYEQLLNCVMYRIIERGGNRIGPRRAFLFAKEFNRDINIPLIYGIDTTDPRLRYFINEYLKSGGNPDLICYVNYFYNINENRERITISIKSLLTFEKKYKYRYTEEEKKLQQTLVGLIANQIEQKKLLQEEIKQSRLIRKLEKSKRNIKKK